MGRQIFFKLYPNVIGKGLDSSQAIVTSISYFGVKPIFKGFKITKWFANCPRDITMICQGREFDFHKSLLTDISSVFKTSFGKFKAFYIMSGR